MRIRRLKGDVYPEVAVFFECCVCQHQFFTTARLKEKRTLLFTPGDMVLISEWSSPHPHLHLAGVSKPGQAHLIPLMPMHYN